MGCTLVVCYCSRDPILIASCGFLIHVSFAETIFDRSLSLNNKLTYFDYFSIRQGRSSPKCFYSMYNVRCLCSNYGLASVQRYPPDLLVYRNALLSRSLCLQSIVFRRLTGFGGECLWFNINQMPYNMAATKSSSPSIAIDQSAGA